MKKNLLVERFQKLAGIKPLYEGETVKKLKEGPYSPDEQNAHLDESVNEAAKEVVLSNEILDFLQERGIIAGTDAQKVHKDLTAFLKEKGVPDEQNAHLDESNGALSSQVEAWLIEEIKGHDANEVPVNGVFELGITKRYYGHDPMALKLMSEMEQLGEITLNIKAPDVYHDDIEDIKVSSVESDYVVVKWGNYVSDDDGW
jgi:hypothetical protein